MSPFPGRQSRLRRGVAANPGPAVELPDLELQAKAALYLPQDQRLQLVFMCSAAGALSDGAKVRRPCPAPRQRAVGRSNPFISKTAHKMFKAVFLCHASAWCRTRATGAHYSPRCPYLRHSRCPPIAKRHSPPAAALSPLAAALFAPAAARFRSWGLHTWLHGATRPAAALFPPPQHGCAPEHGCTRRQAERL